VKRKEVVSRFSSETNWWSSLSFWVSSIDLKHCQKRFLSVSYFPLIWWSLNCSTQFVFCTTTICIPLNQHEISLVNLHLRDLCVFGLKVSLANFFKATFFIKPFFVRHWLDPPSFFPVLIFKHFFAAMIYMFSTFSSVVLTSWIGVLSSMYSRMRVRRSAERKIYLWILARNPFPREIVAVGVIGDYFHVTVQAQRYWC